MISLDEAERIFEAYLRSLEARGATPLVVLREHTIEKPYGWIFFFQSAEYVRTRDYHFLLAGNGPVVVAAADGKLSQLGTATSLEESVATYERDRGLAPSASSTPSAPSAPVIDVRMTELGRIRWPDSALENIAIDYESVSLRIKDSDGAIKVLHADGYIGYNLVGFWDEVVIERVEILDEHEGLDRCLASLRHRHGRGWWGESGSEARNRKKWFALLVHFSDGCVFTVFAASLRVTDG